MAKGSYYYSTFKESSIRSSWTAGKIMQRFTSNWILECCCGSCYTSQKTASTSSTNEADKKKILEPTVESWTPLIDLVKSKNGIELTLDEIPLTKHDYEMSKDDFSATQNATRNEDGASLINHKDDSSIDTLDSRNKSSYGSGTLSSGMKRVIGSLPILPKKEKKSLPSINNEKKVSESDSEIGYCASTFAKCSKRYGQQEVSVMNIPKLIIS